MEEPDIQSIISTASDENCSLLTAADMEALMKKYPFFTLPMAEYVRNNPESDLVKKLMARIAICSPNARDLVMLTGNDGLSLRDFYPAEKPQAAPATTDAISTFLDCYGNPSAKETQVLEKLIFNPQPEYLESSQWKEEHQSTTVTEPQSEQDRLIDSFLEKQETPPLEDEPEPEVVPTQHSDSLNESLAKIYVRQQKFDKAYEIISALNLNNSKKSIYFADQLRFLKKIMLNRNLN